MTLPSPARCVLRIEDRHYPELLKEIPDPPQRLYVLGDPDALLPALAVVGARRATPYGLTATRMLSAWAARAGYPVVSGGAIGCDQAAHRAVLEHDGITVAVMAGGPDVLHPRAAADLFMRIAEEGAIVSEYPWGTTPAPWMFRKRNRIIAGLSAAVLVVEAGLPSGTLSTADHALAAGRDVLAVPGSIFSPTSRGCNRLILQGARPVTDSSDLRDALLSTLGHPASDHPWVPEDAAPLADSLLAALTADPMRPDDAAAALSLDIVAVVRRLGELEAAGTITRYPDGRYGPGSAP